MAKNDGRVIPEGVVEDMQIGAADTAVGDFDLDLLVSTLGFFDIQNADVAISG